MIEELGLATALLIGFALGFVGYAIITFWIGLIWKDFQYSKWYWRLFWIHLILWIVATCVVPMDFLNDTIGVWGKPCLIFYLVSLVLMAIAKIIKRK